MKYLMDTDWIINWLKGKKDTVDKIRELHKDGIAISIISIAEIYEGVFGSNDPDRHEKALKEFISGVTVLDIDEETCKKFGELRNELRKMGNLIGDFDLLIASAALENNLMLLSDNTGHYKRIRGMRFVQPDSKESF